MNGDVTLIMRFEIGVHERCALMYLEAGLIARPGQVFFEFAMNLAGLLLRRIVTQKPMVFFAYAGRLTAPCLSFIGVRGCLWLVLQASSFLSLHAPFIIRRHAVELGFGFHGQP